MTTRKPEFDEQDTEKFLRMYTWHRKVSHVEPEEPVDQADLSRWVELVGIQQGVSFSGISGAKKVFMGMLAAEGTRQVLREHFVLPGEVQTTISDELTEFRQALEVDGLTMAMDALVGRFER